MTTWRGWAADAIGCLAIAFIVLGIIVACSFAGIAPATPTP